MPQNKKCEIVQQTISITYSVEATREVISQSGQGEIDPVVSVYYSVEMEDAQIVEQLSVRQQQSAIHAGLAQMDARLPTSNPSIQTCSIDSENLCESCYSKIAMVVLDEQHGRVLGFERAPEWSGTAGRKAHGDDGEDAGGMWTMRGKVAVFATIQYAVLIPNSVIARELEPLDDMLVVVVVVAGSVAGGKVLNGADGVEPRCEGIVDVDEGGICGVILDFLNLEEFAVGNGVRVSLMLQLLRGLVIHEKIYDRAGTLRGKGHTAGRARAERTVLSPFS
ncbi:hypothetical protein BOTBODRAFT_48470 [Botryobasidium botryosum FD-172 SS1]|uniref:Uncharacterized protein n=1 Tax=Botryobasidium botryosum (strain FD-172 SS1) TaxID=930990 RepID=A0A067M015_BOTB1|nr:hypothetical protein BOTBODRAFT_48470 [Botryobasidium botryosum FD-172 SS1]